MKAETIAKVLKAVEELNSVGDTFTKKDYDNIKANYPKKSLPSLDFLRDHKIILIDTEESIEIEDRTGRGKIKVEQVVLDDATGEIVCTLAEFEKNSALREKINTLCPYGFSIEENERCVINAVRYHYAVSNKGVTAYLKRVAEELDYSLDEAEKNLVKARNKVEGLKLTKKFLASL